MFEMRRFVGYIDSLDGGNLRGWLADRQMASRLEFDLFHNDEYVGRYATGFARPDIPASLSKDPFCEFRIKLPSADVRDAATLRFVVHGCCFQPILQEDGAYRLAFCKKWTHGDSLKKIFSTSTPPAEHRDAPGVWNEFFLETAVKGDFPASDFAHFLRKKYPEAEYLDRTGFYRWYLEDYIPRVDFSLPALLSHQEIEALFSLVGDASAEGGFTSYTAQVARNPPPEKRRFAASRLGHRAYWWACVETKRLALTRSAIPRAYLDALKAIYFRSLGGMPINRFMIEFLRAKDQNVVLPMLGNIKTLYAEIMVRGIRNPLYLDLLPDEGVAAMLDKRFGKTPLSATIENWVGSEALQIVERVAELVFGRESRGPPAQRTAVQFFAPFTSITGLGETSRRLAQAMQDADCDIRYVNVEQNNSAEKCEPPFPLTYATHSCVNIIQTNMDSVPEFFIRSRELLQDSYNVVIPFWELNSPADCHRLGMALVDEIWSASEFIHDCFSIGGTNVKYIGHPARVIPLRPHPSGLGSGKDRRPFQFLSVFDALSWTSRKNTSAAVEAFRLAFPDNEQVSLTVKTQNANHVKGERLKEIEKLKVAIDSDRRISFINMTLSDDEQRAMLGNADCLVSLHRAEGLGIDLLDCLYSGIPVVCTNYSGNIDFCKTETAWLVKPHLIPVENNQYCYVNRDHVWADPSVVDSAAAMISVYENHKERAAKISAALSETADQFSPPVVGARIKGHLFRILRDNFGHISLPNWNHSRKQEAENL